LALFPLTLALSHQGRENKEVICARRGERIEIRRLLLDQGDGGAGGFGYELAVLVRHCHLRDADPPAGSDHTAFSNKLIFYIGTGDKVDVELGGNVRCDYRVGAVGKSLVCHRHDYAAENQVVEVEVFGLQFRRHPGIALG